MLINYGQHDHDADDNIYVNQLWPNCTRCVIGDSIIQGLDERRLGKNNKNVKVRCFPGSTIDDMFHCCKPITKKNPSFIILHVVTNDADKYTSREILKTLLSLKSFIQSELSTCKIILSTPTFRIDKGKCAVLIKHFNKQLRNLNKDILNNDNILGKHVGRILLHLNGRGIGRLAMNILIIYNRCFSDTRINSLNSS